MKKNKKNIHKNVILKPLTKPKRSGGVEDIIKIALQQMGNGVTDWI
jgi:hypothetical protein